MPGENLEFECDDESIELEGRSGKLPYGFHQDERVEALDNLLPNGGSLICEQVLEWQKRNELVKKIRVRFREEQSCA